MKAKNNGRKIFVRITNEEIYGEIKSIKELLEQTIAENRQEHLSISDKNSLMCNDLKGRIKIAQIMAGGAIAISSALAGWFMSYLLK